STHRRSPPPGFLTKSTGEAAEEEEDLMKPFLRLSSIHIFSICCSASDISYIGPNGGLVPGRSLLSWSIYRWGGSFSASVFENKGRNSWNSGGIICLSSSGSGISSIPCLARSFSSSFSASCLTPAPSSSLPGESVKQLSLQYCD